MPFVATVKETASRTSSDQALALTSPFDEWKVLTDNSTYLAETLEVMVFVAVSKYSEKIYDFDFFAKSLHCMY